MDRLPEGEVGNSQFRDKLPASRVIPYSVHQLQIRLQARSRTFG